MEKLWDYFRYSTYFLQKIQVGKIFFKRYSFLFVSASSLRGIAVYEFLVPVVYINT